MHAAQVPGKKIERAWPRGRGRGVPMALGVGEIHESVPSVGVRIEHVLLMVACQCGIELAHILEGRVGK